MDSLIKFFNMERKIAIQGVQGCFHEQAARLFYDGFGCSAPEIVECALFDDLYKSMDGARADAAVMAIENTVSGGLLPNFELLRKYDRKIKGEVFLRIKQNLMALPGQKMEDIKVVINGAGAAGIAIAKFLMDFGVKELVCCSSKGIIVEGDTRFTAPQQELAKITNRGMLRGTLADAMKGADVFIGVSVANCVTKDMVRSMAEKPILFTCANPVPEINPADAKEAGAFIVGTGASQYANQINNVLAFPGIFRGALGGGEIPAGHPETLDSALGGGVRDIPADDSVFVDQQGRVDRLRGTGVVVDFVDKAHDAFSGVLA